MHEFPRLVCVGAEHTALVVMKYNGVSRSCITNRGRSRSHRAYTFDWIIRNRPAASSRARNRLPCLDRETTWTCNLNCIFAWAVIIGDRRIAKLHIGGPRSWCDRDSCQIDRARSTKRSSTHRHHIASHRECARSKGGAGPIPFLVSFGLSSITIPCQTIRTRLRPRVKKKEESGVNKINVENILRRSSLYIFSSSLSLAEKLMIFRHFLFWRILEIDLFDALHMFQSILN